MAQRTFRLTVVAPDKSVVGDLEVTAVGAKGSEGEFTALPGHVPFLTDLAPALMWYRTPDGKKSELLVTGGFVEVLPDKVTILADACDVPGEIDLERAERSRQRQELKLKQAHDKKAAGVAMSAEEEAEMRKAELKLRRAITRIKVAGRFRQQGR
jgi:F-type H+-transporting ATPase subunit epsilon